MSPYRRPSSSQRENRANRSPASAWRRGVPATTPPPSVPLLPPVASADMIAVLGTDIVASTPLGKALGDALYLRVIAEHHRRMRRWIDESAGTEIKETGDGFWTEFARVGDAVRCARRILEGVSEVNRSGGFQGYPLEIRMAVHVTAVTREDRDYRGIGLHDVARYLSAANGGQILLSEAATALLRTELPDGIRVHSHGRFLVRDAPGPVPLFEAVWDGMPGGNAPRPTPAVPPEREPRLPAAFTPLPFFGRDAERERIVRALDSGARLITLTGMGGSGKTRLAVEVARRLAPRFGGAVWFVPFAAVSDPNRIAEEVRAAVGAAESTDSLTALAPVFASGPCLLVLDNLEHLQAADATAVDQFVMNSLERYPHLVLFCTSRHRLGLPPEQEMPLRPFALPPVSSGGKPLSAEQARSWPVVALFEDHARRAHADFAVTDANVDSVLRLCRRLEGLPLALELAAAWARMLIPAEMLARVSEILRSRDRNLPERHRSLQAVLESSYRLLDADQQRVFRALSVFRGGWTITAAESVCDDPFTLDLLTDLSEYFLIVRDDGGEEGTAATTRFTFLESVREFAASRLNDISDERDSVTVRHTAFFAALAEEAEPNLKGAEQAAWLSRLVPEHPNLRACLDRADPLTRLKTASRLYRYWAVRGSRSEGVEVLSCAREDSPEIPPAIAARALQIAGALAMLNQDLETAASLFAACRARFEGACDERGAAMASVNLASIASSQKRFTEAAAFYESALPYWRQEGSASVLATVLTNMGAVESLRNHYDEAKRLHEEAYQIIQTTQDKATTNYILHNLADVLMKMNDNSSSVALAKCIELSIELKDNRVLTDVLLCFAQSYCNREHTELADMFVQAAENIESLSHVAMQANQRLAADEIKEKIKPYSGDSSGTSADTLENYYRYLRGEFLKRCGHLL